MQSTSSSQIKAPAQPIPAHVIERLENEWRQMRQGAANSNTPTQR